MNSIGILLIRFLRSFYFLRDETSGPQLSPRILFQIYPQRHSHLFVVRRARRVFSEARVSYSYTTSWWGRIEWEKKLKYLTKFSFKKSFSFGITKTATLKLFVKRKPQKTDIRSFRALGRRQTTIFLERLFSSLWKEHEEWKTKIFVILKALDKRQTILVGERDEAAAA